MIAQANGVAWEVSLDKARERARREGKALLLDFRVGAASPGDAAIDAPTYRHPQVAAFVREHLVPVKVFVGGPSDAAGSGPGRTPVVAVGGGGGGPHYRVDAFLPPEDFVAQLALGLGRYRFDRREYAEAARCFEDAARQRPGTATAAQALFWLGVARHSLSHGGRPGPPSGPSTSAESLHANR